VIAPTHRDRTDALPPPARLREDRASGGLAPVEAGRGEAAPRLLICLLGGFRLRLGSEAVPLRAGGKGELLLCALALRGARGVPQETLLATLWPDSATALASQSLSSLVYSLNRLLGDALGAAPVVHADGCYRLNAAAGVAVDVEGFEALASDGDRHARAGHDDAAAEAYGRAVGLYRGDLPASSDLPTLLERERLRALYLNLLARLADHTFGRGEYAECLERALRLLAHDPCREDAHRLVMRCYVRRGERAQALRQYRLCETLLRSEFDAAPEPATRDLFDRIRLDPGGV
jgi:DNA-binding SARP family transcriptional activator